MKPERNKKSNFGCCGSKNQN